MGSFFWREERGHEEVLYFVWFFFLFNKTIFVFLIKAFRPLICRRERLADRSLLQGVFVYVYALRLSNDLRMHWTLNLNHLHLKGGNLEWNWEWGSLVLRKAWGNVLNIKKFLNINLACFKILLSCFFTVSPPCH